MNAVVKLPTLTDDERTALRDGDVASRMNAAVAYAARVLQSKPSDAALIERERCARIAEEMRPAGGRMWSDEQAACFAALTDCANFIRAGSCEN